MSVHCYEADDALTHASEPSCHSNHPWCSSCQVMLQQSVMHQTCSDHGLLGQAEHVSLVEHVQYEPGPVMIGIALQGCPQMGSLHTNIGLGHLVIAFAQGEVNKVEQACT